MPYKRDLIAERDEKIRLYNSVIKWWRVKYIDLETRKKIQKEEESYKLALEVAARLEAEAAEDEAIKQAEIAKVMAQAEEDEKHYNPTTGTYSGRYGKNVTLDEKGLNKVEKILSQKENEIQDLLTEYSE